MDLQTSLAKYLCSIAKESGRFRLIDEKSMALLIFLIEVAMILKYIYIYTVISTSVYIVTKYLIIFVINLKF